MKIPTLLLLLAIVHPVYASDSALPAFYNDLEQLLLHRMNFSVDPCEDFYTYACGNTDHNEANILKENYRIFKAGLNALLHSDRHADLKSSTAVSKALKLYESCVKKNLTGSDIIANLKENVIIFMEKFNFPTDFFFNADADVKINREKFSDILKYVHDNFFVEPFFQTLGLQNNMMPFKNYNATSFGFLVLDKMEVTFNYIAYNCASSDVLSTFASGVRALTNTLGWSATDVEVEETAKKFMELEFQLLGIPCQNKSIVISTDLATLESLSYSHVSMDLDNLITKLIATGVGNNPFNYDNFTMVVNDNPLKIVSNTSDADLLRYMLFRIITKNAIQKASDCLDLQTSMPLVKSRIYTETKYATTGERKSVQNKIETMIKAIKKNLKDMVLSMPWIKKDKRAYNALVKKFDKMRYEVAIEADLLNNTWLDEYYKQIQFNDGDTFFDMRSKVLKFELYGKVRQLLYKVTNEEVDLTNSNAAYGKLLNKFVINDGYLIAPNYHKNYLDSYNWGSIGFTSAHEIGHSVDNSNIDYDDAGYYNPFLGESSRKEMEKMTSCVVEEYDKIQVLPGNYTPNHVNGQLTLNENLADSTGLEAVYRAFKDFTKKNPKEKRLRHPKLRGLTRDQMFFLGSTQIYCVKQEDSFIANVALPDVHSPNKARAAGTLPNIPAFGRAFKCPVGSKYRPVKHCNVWTH